MPAIILMSVWKNFGFNMVIFMAGLQSIPERVYEAASIDGASAWQQFWHITLPMLAPTFVFVGVMTLIGNFQLFAEPYVMTQGGPSHSTLSIVLLHVRGGLPLVEPRLRRGARLRPLRDHPGGHRADPPALRWSWRRPPCRRPPQAAGGRATA